MIKITFHYKYTDPDHSYWTADRPLPEDIRKYDDKLLRWYPRKRIGDLVHTELNFLEIAEFLKLITLDGGTVQGFNPYVKILTSDMDKAVPYGLPARDMPAVLSQPDMESDYDNFIPVVIEPARPKTWDEWILPNHFPIVYGEYSYFPACWGNPPLCDYLRSSELLAIYNDPNTELISSTEFTSIQESNIETIA